MLSIVTFLSDFGLKDPYVAEMKAAILSISPEARMVDISHGIEKFNVRMGAFILASAAPRFPVGAIHLAVVDPGVGTKRRPLIVETERSFYVGPDNGLLTLSARKEGVRHVYKICSQEYMLPEVSRTFHGRDIFAPVAAHLSNETSPARLGVEIHDYVLPSFAEPQIRKAEILGEILYIDGFGNIVTNISAKTLQGIGISENQPLRVKLRDEVLDLKLCSAYGQVPQGKPLAIIGGSDFLEISVNQANAAHLLGVRSGEAVNASVR